MKRRTFLTDLALSVSPPPIRVQRQFSILLRARPTFRACLPGHWWMCLGLISASQLRYDSGRCSKNKSHYVMHFVGTRQDEQLQTTRIWEYGQDILKQKPP